MNIHKHYSIALLACFIIAILVTKIEAVCPVVTPVNPKTGENLWQLSSRIGTAVDDLLYTTSLCCACTCFITQADVPNYIISQPGIYCVAESISLDDLSLNPAIDVQSSDVVIDFRGNKISVATGTQPVLRVSGNNANIIIRNAIIETEATAAACIELNGTRAIVIENCIVRSQDGAGIGIACQNACDTIVIDNCIAHDCGNIGFSFDNGIGTSLVHNCLCVNVGQAFKVTNGCGLITFDSCHGWQCGAGFSADASCVEMIYKNCEASSNFGIGFAIDASLSRIQNCEAFANIGDGFFINSPATANANIEVVQCLAYNNSGVGIHNGLLANSFIFNNVSSSNSGGNYLNVTAATLITSAAVTTTTGYWSNING